MTQIEYDISIRRIFRECKKILNLPKNWKIKIVLDNNIKEYANVNWDYPKKIFTIHLNPERNKSLDDLTDTIIHEMLHILFAKTSTKIDKLLHKAYNKEKIYLKQTETQFEKIEESLVRHLTLVICAALKGRNHAQK